MGGVRVDGAVSVMLRGCTDVWWFFFGICYCYWDFDVLATLYHVRVHARDESNANVVTDDAGVGSAVFVWIVSPK